MTIVEEIRILKHLYDTAKPRSRRKAGLEARLKALKLRQLKQEIRAEKRKAA